MDLTKKQIARLLLNRFLKLEVCNAIHIKVAGGDLDEASAARSWQTGGDIALWAVAGEGTGMGSCFPTFHRILQFSYIYNKDAEL